METQSTRIARTNLEKLEDLHYLVSRLIIKLQSVITTCDVGTKIGKATSGTEQSSETDPHTFSQLFCFGFFFFFFFFDKIQRHFSGNGCSFP
jgi:hypothetical protein